MKRCLRWVACVVMAWSMAACTSHAQQSGAPAPTSAMTWDLEDSGGQRFVAAHGEHAALMGYSREGLEFWAYPLQVFSGYSVSFREPGEIAPLDGVRLLRRVEYRPDEVIRVYVGPDFVVREHLVIPYRTAAAAIRFEVQGRPAISVLAHFVPSMNAMWPAALGGQSIRWDDAAKGYELEAPADGFRAVVASPQAVAHDAATNFTVAPRHGYTLELKPVVDGRGDATATLYAAMESSGSRPPNAWLEKHTATADGEPARDADIPIAALAAQGTRLEAKQEEQTAQTLAQTLEIETPDALLNRSLAWAEIALDEAWVCNRMLGCGEVAGYGPSRAGRRPQYDWFFAGDGMVATEALLASGQFARARDELAFIASYRNPQNGMIWHELSQSAGLIDWLHDYRYMYVHVDITFQYLATMQEYLRATGDLEFVRASWPGLQAAYDYCASVVNASTALPEIPADKEGENEQERLRDELALSGEWLGAARAYAELARATGHDDDARKAASAAQKAKGGIQTRYWDESRHFWIAGHTESGAAMVDHRTGPTHLLMDDVFTREQSDAVLDRLCDPLFLTDWGVRSMSEDSPSYDPNSYSAGSVSLLASASLASTLWAAHRPAAAWELLRGLLDWNTLDSGGHMHEVLAGDLYHAEIESVPEQTWSSAGLLSSAVHGLLGLQVDGAAHAVTLAPHLPPDWDHINMRRIRVGGSTLDARVKRITDGLELDMTNSGAPVELTFSPQIPQGAVMETALLAGKTIPATVERHRDDEHATVRFRAPSGEVRCVLRYRGGADITVVKAAPHIGDRSHAPKLVSEEFAADVLAIHVFTDAAAGGELELKTSETPSVVSPASGISLVRAENDVYRIKIGGSGESLSSGYASETVRIALAPRTVSTSAQSN